jgi:anti-anti-sigma factor
MEGRLLGIRDGRSKYRERSESKSNLSYALIRDSVEGAEVLHAFGELDLSMTSDLESALESISEGASALVLDLTACNYLDSTVIAVIVRSVKKWDGRIAIVVPEDSVVRRVFRVVELEHVLPIETTLESASRRLELSKHP